MSTHHKIIFNISGLIVHASFAPIIVAIILGIPKSKNIFLSQCFQKSENLEILPKM